MTSWIKFIIYDTFNIHDVSEYDSAAEALYTLIQFTVHNVRHKILVT